MEAARSDRDGVNQPQAHAASAPGDLPLNRSFAPPSWFPQASAPPSSSSPWFLYNTFHPIQPKSITDSHQWSDIHSVDLRASSQAFPTLVTSSSPFPQLDQYTRHGPVVPHNDTQPHVANAYEPSQPVTESYLARIQTTTQANQGGHLNCYNPVFQSGRPPVQRREKRCLKCRLDEGHGPCLDYPLCTRCIPEAQNCNYGEGLFDGLFLDWKRVFTLCTSLRGGLDRLPEAVIETKVTDPWSTISRDGIVILEFSFSDRTEEKHHIVVLRSHEQEEMRTFDPSPTDTRYRAPVLDLSQLDCFVRAAVWSPTLWEFHEENGFVDRERELWLKVRMFIGYLSLTHNISTTLIRSCGFMPEEIQQRIAIELIYTFFWRLQMLWFEICSTCMELTKDEQITKRPVEVFFALEILHHLMSTMRQSDWKLPHQSPPHPLVGAQLDFNSRVESILSRIRAFDCLASGNHQAGPRPNRAPNLLHFARSAEVPSFPSHCVVTAYRNHSLPHLVPFFCDAATTRRLVDVLGSRSSHELHCDSTGDSTTPPPYLDERNMVHRIRDPHKVATSAHGSENDERCPKRRKKRDGRPVIVTTIPPVEESRALDSITNQADYGSFGSSRGGTPVPSLTSSTPESTDSPATPSEPGTFDTDPNVFN